MTDFTLPNGNTLRIDDEGSREIEKGTGVILWPSPTEGMIAADGKTLTVRQQWGRVSRRVLRRVINEFNRKKKRAAQ